jgi:Flp pilus assembly protein protease CpaA
VFLWLRHLFLFAFLGAAALWDCRTGKIPNPLNLLGALLGLTMVLAELRLGDRPEALLLGGVVAAGALLLLYLSGGVGGGDVKMGIGFGLLSGYPDVVRHLFFGGLAALILIVGRLAWRGELWTGLRRATGRKSVWVAPGQASEEAARPERGGASTSLALAFLIGVAWVYLMQELG